MYSTPTPTGSSAPAWVPTNTASPAPAATPEPAPAWPVADAPVPMPPPPLPPLSSPDGSFLLTDTHLTLQSQQFALLTLDRGEVTAVRWQLWLLLGGLTLAGVMIAFLQNWLRTLPAMASMAAATLLMAYGYRGTNRLRLLRPHQDSLHFSLPGDLAAWQRLTGELNRRIRRAHDRAAAEAAAALAAEEAAAEAARQAYLAAQLPPADAGSA